MPSFMQTLDEKVYQQLKKLAEKRGITIQDLLRAVIIPYWLRTQNLPEWTKKQNQNIYPL